MPEMDGFDLARRVSAELGNAPPNILLISGSDESERPRTTDPAAVIGLLPKPFAMNALIRAVGLIECARCRCPGVAGLARIIHERAEKTQEKDGKPFRNLL